MNTMLTAQCDDIAINAIAGNLTGFAPLFVVSGIRDVGTVKGAHSVDPTRDLTFDQASQAMRPTTIPNGSAASIASPSSSAASGQCPTPDTAPCRSAPWHRKMYKSSENVQSQSSSSSSSSSNSQSGFGSRDVASTGSTSRTAAATTDDARGNLIRMPLTRRTGVASTDTDRRGRRTTGFAGGNKSRGMTL